MATKWKVNFIPLDYIEQQGSDWEPFALFIDEDGTQFVIGKKLVEIEGDRSTVTEGSLRTPGYTEEEPNAGFPPQGDL
jgi:hypothetical protein